MGNMARTLLGAGVAGSYVVIDIPSSLVFSYMFLRLCFPAKSAVFATSIDEARSAIGSVNLVFIPSHFDQALDGFRPDLFLNTASLGEMPNTTIRHWLGLVQERADPRYLLVSNRYLNPVPPFAVEQRSNENEASVLYDHRWRVRHWWFDPFYGRCPYACLGARNLEMILERLPEGDPSRADQSAALFMDMFHEEWLSIVNLGKQALVDNAAARSLSVDTTTRGTLFKLWESIRLHPNLHNVTMMLVYLDFLRDDGVDEFEETYFYERTLREMIAAFEPSQQSRTLEAWLDRKEEKRQAIAQLHSRFGETDTRGLFDAIQGLA